MEGVYDVGAVYTISANYVKEYPVINVQQISGNSYDGISGHYYQINSEVKIIPVGFDVKKQEVIVTGNDVSLKNEYQETYIYCNEMRNRVVSERTNNISFTARISKQDFIANAKLVTI